MNDSAEAADGMQFVSTSRSENLDTAPLLGAFPSSLTEFFKKCLHISRIFAYFA